MNTVEAALKQNGFLNSIQNVLKAQKFNKNEEDKPMTKILLLYVKATKDKNIENINPRTRQTSNI